MYMKQSELIDELAKFTGASQKQTKDFLNALGELVCAAVTDGQEVVLPKLGKIKAKLRPARKGRNLQTGAAVVYPAKYVPSIVIAKALKDAAEKVS